METVWNNLYAHPALVPSLLIAVLCLLVAILYNVRRSRMMYVDKNAQRKEKEPEEHDERFATGKHGHFCREVCKVSFWVT